MCKKLILAIFICVLASSVSYSETILSPQSIEDEVIQVEKPAEAYTLMNRIRKDRNTIYNVLNLTPSQICKTREIEQQRFEEITPLVDELLFVRKQIREGTSSGASKKEINALCRQSDKIEKQIRKICNKYDKCFERLLNSEQKSKYKMVQKLRFDDLEKMKKIDKYGRKPSDLRPFGYGISQPAYLEDLNEQRSFKNKIKKVFKKDCKDTDDN